MNTIKTKYIFDIFSGATPKSSILPFWDGNIVWVTPADYKSEDKYINDSEKHITEDGYNSCATNLVPKGSIVVAKRAPIGTVAIANLPLCTNQGCLSCVPHKNINSTFYYYVLFAWNQHMDKLGQGTTFMEIPFKAFRNMKVPLYPVQQQGQIVSYLDAKCDAIDKAIAYKRSVIEKLKEYRSAVITKAVTKGLNPNVEMKDSKNDILGYIPKNWDFKRMKFVVDVIRGGSPRPIEQFLSDTGYNWIKISDATNNGKFINSTEQKIIPEGLSKTRFVKKNTLLLTNSMSFGHPYFLNIDGCIHDGWLAFLNYKKILKEFLYYILISDTSMAQFLTSADGSVVGNLNIQKVRNSLVALPSQEEQKQIIDYLDVKCSKIDKSIHQQEQAIAKLEEYRKSVIYYAVTGKIDCGKAV